jgi:hypothetical protein
MSVDPDHLGRAGGALADVGRLVERVAHAVGPASSALGRLTAAVSVVKLGARLIPAGARLLRRYPAGSLLAAAGFLGALYLMRSGRVPSRRRYG